MVNKITSDANVEQILFLKGLKLNAVQVSKITGFRPSDVKRVMNAKKLRPAPDKKVFDWSDYNNSMI